MRLQTPGATLHLQRSCHAHRSSMLYYCTICRSTPLPPFPLASCVAFWPLAGPAPTISTNACVLHLHWTSSSNLDQYMHASLSGVRQLHLNVLSLGRSVAQLGPAYTAAGGCWPHLAARALICIRHASVLSMFSSLGTLVQHA